MKKDYCTLSPDNWFGVNISKCCKEHDKYYEYKNKSLKHKINSDIKLKDCIIKTLVKESKSKTKSYFVGYLYLTILSISGYVNYLKG